MTKKCMNTRWSAALLACLALAACKPPEKGAESANKEQPAAAVESDEIQLPQGMFANPLFANGADPWLEYYDGNYYLTTTTWTSQLVMRKSPTLDGLATAAPVNIWSDTDPARCCNIDGSYLEHDGQLYLLWSEWVGDELLNWISKMTNPWTIEGPRVVLTRPQAEWEKSGRKVNEGPEILERDGRTFLIYSAGAYRLANVASGNFFGAERELSPWNNTEAQRWQLQQDENGWATLTNRQTGQVLAAAGCSGDGCERWRLQPAEEVAIASVQSGRVLQGCSSVAAINQGAWNGGDCQRWS